MRFEKPPLPALELSKNCVMPPSESLDGGPLLVKTVRFPTVALFLNCIIPRVPVISAVVTRFWVVPELFAIPAPLTVNVNMGPAAILNALAPGLNTMLFTCVLAEIETPVVLEDANVAVSEGPLGMVGGVQFAAWFQSLVGGLVFHVALPAKLLLVIESRSSPIATAISNSGHRRRGRGESIASDVDEEKRMVLFIILLSGLHRHFRTSPPMFPAPCAKIANAKFSLTVVARRATEPIKAR
jgi:hypothetical protein